jgi:hypothetical protein
MSEPSAKRTCASFASAGVGADDLCVRDVVLLHECVNVGITGLKLPELWQHGLGRVRGDTMHRQRLVVAARCPPTRHRLLRAAPRRA